MFPTPFPNSSLQTCCHYRVLLKPNKLCSPSEASTSVIQLTDVVSRLSAEPKGSCYSTARRGFIVRYQKWHNFVRSRQKTGAERHKLCMVFQSQTGAPMKSNHVCQTCSMVRSSSKHLRHVHGSQLAKATADMHCLHMIQNSDGGVDLLTAEFSECEPVHICPCLVSAVPLQTTKSKRQLCWIDPANINRGSWVKDALTAPSRGENQALVSLGSQVKGPHQHRSEPQ